MKSAVLVIDVQRGLFEKEPRPDQADQVVDRINGITKQARTENVPVFLIQHERESGFLAFGSPSWKLEQGLDAEVSDHKIRKTTPDSFLRTGLYEALTALGIQRLIVCGYATEFCVDTTVRRAAALGFEVTLVADAHTTHDKAHAKAQTIRIHHNATLPDITSFGPKIEAIGASDIRFEG